MGGSLDPEPDPQSPFYDPETSGRPPVDGRPGLRVVRAQRSLADLDLALLPDPHNLDRLAAALAELEAEVIAVPPLALEHLTEGLAVHFRCRQAEAAGLRIDIMSRMRGVASFADLWARRTTLDFGDETLEVLSLPDLVAATKTQRDKDWPMIRRLVDVNYLSHRDEPTSERLRFWLRELRTPELLVEAAQAHADVAAGLVEERPLLKLAQEEHRRQASSPRPNIIAWGKLRDSSAHAEVHQLNNKFLGRCNSVLVWLIV